MDADTTRDDDLARLYDAARQLGASLSHRDTRTKLTIFAEDSPGGRPGNPGTGAVGYVVTITGKTMLAAYEHAKELTESGCNCVSSGETEFTCTCPD